MTEAGLSVGTDQVAQGYFTYRSGPGGGGKAAGRGCNPTAIFASNDDMAAATMAVAHRRGLDVPGDLSVAGFDDTPLATTVWPPLTTVRQPIAEMAREAVRLLVEQIRGRRAGRRAASGAQNAQVYLGQAGLHGALEAAPSRAAPPAGTRASRQYLTGAAGCYC